MYENILDVDDIYREYVHELIHNPHLSDEDVEETLTSLGYGQDVLSSLMQLRRCSSRAHNNTPASCIEWTTRSDRPIETESASIMTQCATLEEGKHRNARMDDAVKKAILNKYDLLEVKACPNGNRARRQRGALPCVKPEKDTTPQCRYYNGVPVKLKRGEKYLTIES